MWRDFAISTECFPEANRRRTLTSCSDNGEIGTARTADSVKSTNCWERPIIFWTSRNALTVVLAFRCARCLPYLRSMISPTNGKTSQRSMRSTMAADREEMQIFDCRHFARTEVMTIKDVQGYRHWGL